MHSLIICDMECTGSYFLHNFKYKDSSKFNETALNNGISIYEVIRIEKSIPLFLENHLDRLFNSADLSNLNINESYCDFETLISELIKKNNIPEGKIKIVIHFSEDNRQEEDVLIYFTPHYFPTTEEYINGVKVGICNAERQNPNAKVLNTEARQRANNTIAEKKLFEVLLTDHMGYISEGSRSNVFFIKDNSIVTPPAKDVLMGITRNNVIKICKESKIKILEQKVHLNDVSNMDAAFLSGTSLKVLPVSCIDEKIINHQHDLLKKLQDLYNTLIQDYVSERLT